MRNIKKQKHFLIIFFIFLLFILILSQEIQAYETIYSMGSVSIADDGTVAASYIPYNSWSSYYVKITDKNDTSTFKKIKLAMTTSDSHTSTYSTEISNEPLNLDISDSFYIQVIGNDKENACISEIKEYLVNKSPIITSLPLVCFIKWGTPIEYDKDWNPKPDQLPSGENIKFNIELVPPYTNSLSYDLINRDTNELIESKLVCNECDMKMSISLPELEQGNYAINISATNEENKINRYREFNVNAKAGFDFIIPGAANNEPIIIGDNIMHFEATVNETIRLEVEAYDENNDTLEYYWFIDGIKKTNNKNSILFTPDEVRDYFVVLNISDGMVNTTVIWNISVVKEQEKTPYTKTTKYHSVIMGGGYSTINYGTTVIYDIVSIESFFLEPNKYNYDIKISEHGRYSDEIKALRTLDTEVYKYFKIELENTEKIPKIFKVNMEFRIKNSWLKQKKIDKKDIVLFRYEKNKWNQLNTEYNGQDNIYSYYTAESPGFSYFAIGEHTKTQDVLSTIITSPIITENKNQEFIKPKQDKKSKEITVPEGISEFGVYLLILLIFLMGTIVLMYLVKKNKPLM